MKRQLTSVFPEPLAPAIDVISPYRNPPCKARSSMIVRPELADDGRVFAWASAAPSSVEARIPGAA